MTDEYLYLWAQWGILNFEQYQIVLKAFGDHESAWKKIDRHFLSGIGIGSEKADRILEIRELISFHDIVKKMEDCGVRLLSIEDNDYPSCLKSIHDPPPFLFVRGKLPSFHRSLGVVGTRSITPYGRMVSEKFVADLVHNGFVIVSGLALGVDSCAHETALKNSGITVGVLGSGVDEIYPSGNRSLAERIIKQGGAIISEYPLGTPAMKHHFPERNRIISGLSCGILVAEGGVKSGALITARLALEHGREVFAVPNNITKINLSGTNHLIRRGEAKLVERTEHILEEFQMEPAQRQLSFDFDDTEKSVLTLLSAGGKTMDELIIGTAWPVPRLSGILTGLQLKGAVRMDGNRWVLF
jgi:DNA processing protein